MTTSAARPHAPALLRRQAENLYWLGRHVERAEALATLLHGLSSQTESSFWPMLLRLRGDEAMFSSLHDGEADAVSVHRFYETAGHADALPAIVARAHGNARVVRVLLAEPVWEGLNRLNRAVADGTPCGQDVRESLRIHAGLMARIAYRDEADGFHRLGSVLEGAQEAIRLISAPLRGLSAEWWRAVLRIQGGFHAWRRLRPHRQDPEDCGRFLLLEPRFAPSLAARLAELEEACRALRLRTAVQECRALRGELAWPLSSDAAASLTTGLAALHDHAMARWAD